MRLNRILPALFALLFVCVPAMTLADVVETKNGAKLVGTVTAISGGNVTLQTDYAGTLTIKQSEVASIRTDSPLVIRLSGGTTMAGTLGTQNDGRIVIQGEDGVITTSVDRVSTTWAPGGTDPAVTALKRRWSYEASADVTGKRGNSSELGTAFGFRARLSGPDDTLQFYTNYNRQKSNGVTSSDRFVAGADYANNFSGRYSWYARDEMGFDRSKDIRFYNVAAAGIGYDFIQNAPRQTLTGRTGLSFRYETYDTAAADVESLGLDFALLHSFLFKNARMNNALTFVPAFDDFGNYRAVHDTNFDLPIGSSDWRVRFGVNHDYNSQPGPGVKKLDTTFYTRMVLSWQ